MYFHSLAPVVFAHEDLGAEGALVLSLVRALILHSSKGGNGGRLCTIRTCGEHVRPSPSVKIDDDIGRTKTCTIGRVAPADLGFTVDGIDDSDE